MRVDAAGFVVVDECLRTSNPRIRAAGDVTGHPLFTHVAGVHGSIAASNAVLGLRRRAGGPVPRVVHTAPEVAAVGFGLDASHVTVAHDDVDRAVCDGATDGITRRVLDRRGRVAGATVVGPRAADTPVELTLALRLGLAARDLAATMHPNPTFGDGPWKAAILEVRSRLVAPAAHTATRALAAARRRLLDRIG